MGQAPIHPQSLLGLSLSFRPRARVDLGVSVQRGFGGLAPWAVTVQFLTLSLGKTYEERAATPVVQLAADAAVATARAIHEYIKSLPIDPVLDERCMLWDDDGELLVQQPLGTRTPDGKYCLVEGEKLPIGENWWRDRKKSVICHDKKLGNCLMSRRPREHSYRVLHRPWVGDDCVLRESVYDPEAPARQPGQTHRTVEQAVIGALTKDKTGCTDQAGYVHPIGTQYYREHTAHRRTAGQLLVGVVERRSPKLGHRHAPTAGGAAPKPSHPPRSHPHPPPWRAAQAGRWAARQAVTCRLWGFQRNVELRGPTGGGGSDRLARANGRRALP